MLTFSLVLLPLAGCCLRRAYLCWWYVNAMLNVWEAIGGRWLLDTRLLILFYRLLGARVRPTLNPNPILILLYRRLGARVRKGERRGEERRTGDRSAVAQTSNASCFCLSCPLQSAALALEMASLPWGPSGTYERTRCSSCSLSPAAGSPALSQ